MSQAFGQDTWTATAAIITWHGLSRNGFQSLERERQDEAWSKILAYKPNPTDDFGSLEDASPLLYWLGQGWITEGVLFQRDMELLKQIITELEIREEDLNLELTELEEQN